MSFFKKNRFRIAAAVYWLLLAYILAALVFWFIELQTQSQRMTNYKVQELKMDDPSYQTRLNEINQDQHLKNTQYIGEGSIFLLVILVGAIFLYRAVMLQIRLQQQQQNFMMAVTHELKTPIAVTKLNLETLLKHRLEDEKKIKIIQSALQETNRLNTITNNILVSAQLEGGHYLIANDEIDLSYLLLTCLMDFRNRFPDRIWKLDIEPEIGVLGDGLLLQILVNNLIENAIKYSPRETVIEARLRKEKGRPALSIIDQGAGIPGPEKKKVFNKFYRLGNEETRTAQGTGLGLYLCKKIAADHRAIIQI
ncbi:MAG: sensor histidine kinase, partial [Chitinophagales bacterium]